MIPMGAVDPGKWYLAVECRHPQCGRAIIICQAPDDSTKQISIEENYGASVRTVGVRASTGHSTCGAFRQRKDREPPARHIGRCRNSEDFDQVAN
jgi:hypothetical protein